MSDMTTKSRQDRIDWFENLSRTKLDRLELTSLCAAVFSLWMCCIAGLCAIAMLLAAVPTLAVILSICSVAAFALFRRSLDFAQTCSDRERSLWHNRKH